MKHKTVSLFNDTDLFDWKIEQLLTEGWYCNGFLDTAIDNDGNVLYTQAMMKTVTS